MSQCPLKAQVIRMAVQQQAAATSAEVAADAAHATGPPPPPRGMAWYAGKPGNG